MLALRKKEPALRRGRQYLREISEDGNNFSLPCMIGNQIRSLVSWSRLFVDEEMVLAINTDPGEERSAWVTIDNSLHETGNRLTCLYSTLASEIGKKCGVETKNGKAVHLSAPKGGFVFYRQTCRDDGNVFRSTTNLRLDRGS